MSEHPQSGSDEPAGGEEGGASDLSWGADNWGGDNWGAETWGAENSYAAGSGFGYAWGGYSGHMSSQPPISPPPPAWPAPSGDGGWGEESGSHGAATGSPEPGGWRWDDASSGSSRWRGGSESGGWGSGSSEPGGWRWDDRAGGWRWEDPRAASGWSWDDYSGGWRWADPRGSGGGGWGDPTGGSGGWGGGHGYPGHPGGPGWGRWDSEIPWQGRPSRRGARILTALLAAALVAAVVGAGLGSGAWRSSAGHVNPAPSGGSTGGGSSSPQPGNGSSGAGNPAGNGGPVAPGSTPSGSTGSNISASPATTESIGKQVAPALVDINTSLSFSQEQAAGTGIVLTSTGEILTNNHVINGETSIQVTDVGNGKTYNAKVVGYDHSHDVAVVQLIGASGLATATIGDSSRVTTGQSVVAVGNAGGTGGEPSISGGSITSLNQSITASDEGDGTSEQLNDLIQSNAPIQPGDSGGSLVNMSGQVIGMNTAASDGFSIQSGSRSTEGFSIPINRAMAIVQDIEAGRGSGTVHVGATAFLGVTVANQANSSSSGSGATISQVIANGAAASAGLVAGDTITALGGRTVSSSTDLTDLMEIYHPGQTASVNYVDGGGQTHTVTVTLASGPPS